MDTLNPVEKKMGRPRTTKPKGVKHDFRMDEETESRLEDYCREMNISKGEACRRGLEMLLTQAGK